MKISTVDLGRESTNRIQKFAKKIHTVKKAIADLPGEEYYAEVLAMIERPEWKAAGEGIFFEALVDTIQHRLDELAELHKRLRFIAEASEEASLKSRTKVLSDEPFKQRHQQLAGAW